MCAALGLLLLLLPACRPSAEQAARERYVVVLSMDGFRSDYPLRAHTPVLDSIGAAGVRGAFRPSYPSLTFPNHYSMATGLYPDHHGLVHNTFYDAAIDSLYTTASHDPRFYGGEPIWNTAERQGVRTATYYWVGSEVPLPGGQPGRWKPFDKTVPFATRADSVLSWLQLPEAERPHLIMWYVEEPDRTAHYCSPDSAATLRMVEHLDSLVGRFFAKVRELPIYEKTDFIIVSDHGMAACDWERPVNLARYLPRDSFVQIVEGVPALLYPKKSYKEIAYAVLKRVPGVTVWRREEVPAKYHYGQNPRVGSLVVAPEVGRYVQFRKQSEAFRGMAGAHGYDNYAPEMEAIFYATGPSFKQQAVVPAMDNVNLYLLLAHLLGVQPAPNDGDTAAVNQLLAIPMPPQKNK